MSVHDETPEQAAKALGLGEEGWRYLHNPSAYQSHHLAVVMVLSVFQWLLLANLFDAHLAWNAALLYYLITLGQLLYVRYRVAAWRRSPAGQEFARVQMALTVAQQCRWTRSN